MIEFTMPALGADMDEGTPNEWMVQPGDTVTRGQIVAVVETTKAAVEIECWHDGVIGELLVPIGQTVAVGTALATILNPARRPSRGRRRWPRPQPRPRPRAPSPRPSHTGGRGAGAGRARQWCHGRGRTAASLGVDLKGLTGTGPQGAITLQDVEHAAATAHHEAPHPPPKPAESPSPSPRPRRRGRAVRPCARRSPR
jgi:pyruvate dehydrogenase E2 component (dihydrolipoamide acetyltransferase)